MSHPPTDTRDISRRLERGLARWIVFFLVVVGAIVIALVYGTPAAIVGALCLAAGAGIFGLLYLIVTLMERWAERDS